MARGFIYFITAGPFVKIGHSRDVARRLAQLQVGCPYPLRVSAVVAGGKYLEQQYHLRFLCQAVRLMLPTGPVPFYGRSIPRPVNEWFHLEGDLLKYVTHIAAGGAPLWSPGGPEFNPFPGAFDEPVPDYRCSDILIPDATGTDDE